MLPPHETGIEDGRIAAGTGPAGSAILAGDRLRIEAESGQWETTAQVVLCAPERIEVELDQPGPETDGRIRGGTRVRLYVGRADGAWMQPAVVSFRSSAERVVLDLEPGRIARMQRREYFRLGVRLPIAVGLGLPEGMPRLFRVLDLSGGGCFVHDEEETLDVGEEHDACLDLRDQRAPLNLRVTVVRRGQVSGETGAGLQFLGLQESSRERIMRALFDQFRRERIRLGVTPASDPS